MLTESKEFFMSEKKPKGMKGKDASTRQRVASLGGKAAQASGRAHKFNSQSASDAAKKRHSKD